MIEIATLDDLKKIGNDSAYPLNGDYVLKPNLGLGFEIDSTFTGIGTETAPFTGTFRGGAIALTFGTVNYCSGMFNYVQGATIRDVAFSYSSDGSVLANYDADCGALIGTVLSDTDTTVIANCMNLGVSVHGRRAGGLIGRVDNGATVQMSGCCVTSLDESATSASSKYLSIESYINDGSYTRAAAGGLIGYCEGSVSMTGCSVGASTGDVITGASLGDWGPRTGRVSIDAKAPHYSYAGGLIGCYSGNSGSITTAMSDCIARVERMAIYKSTEMIANLGAGGLTTLVNMGSGSTITISRCLSYFYSYAPSSDYTTSDSYFQGLLKTVYSPSASITASDCYYVSYSDSCGTKVSSSNFGKAASFGTSLSWAADNTVLDKSSWYWTIRTSSYSSFPIIYYRGHINFTPNGGSGQYYDDSWYYESSKCPLTLPASTIFTPPATGDDFQYWSEYSNGGGSDKYQPGASYTVSASQYINAIWKSTVSYTMTWDENGGTVVSGSDTPPTGTTVSFTAFGNYTVPSTPPTPPSDAPFIYWQLFYPTGAPIDSSTTQQPYIWNPGDYIDFNADDTYYTDFTVKAIYATKYTITYVGNITNVGNVPPATLVYELMQTSISSTVPTVPDTATNRYVFNKWNTAADSSGTSYTSGQSFTMPSGNLTLYAQWTPYYAVAYSSNGATSGATPPTEYHAGGTIYTIASSNLVKTGYTTLNQWNTAADGSGTVYFYDALETMPSAPITLYQQYSINTYALSVTKQNLNFGAVTAKINGTAVAPQWGAEYSDGTYQCSDATLGGFNYGAGVVLTASANSGYVFAGWFLSGAAIPVSTDASYSFSMPPQNLTVIARFVSNQCIVSIITPSGQSVNAGSTSGAGTYSITDTVTVTATAADGWLFAGWYLITNGNAAFLSESAYYSFKAAQNSYVLSAAFTSGRPITDFEVLVVDTGGATVNIVDTVISYTIHGGPEQPIRYIDMEINKRILNNRHPNVVLTEGATAIYISAVGRGTFMAEKISLKDYTYTVLAYGVEEVLNGTVLSEAVSGITPSACVSLLIHRYLDNTLGSGVPFPMDVPLTSNLVTAYNVSFPAGTNVMAALYVCSLMDGRFIFFADDTCYYVDYNDIQPIAANEGMVASNGVLNVYPDTVSSYTDYLMLRSVVRLSSQGTEGTDTVVNGCIAKYGSGTLSESASNASSAAKYGQYSKTFDTMLSGTDDDALQLAKRAAANVVLRYKDPSNSLTFTCREVGSAGWHPTFSTYAFAYAVIDRVNQVGLTNVHPCDGSTENARLRLSTYERHYPQCYTVYRFGVAKQADLTQTIAGLQNTK